MPLRSRAHEAPRNPIYRTAEQQIRDEREKQNDDDELERIHAPEDHDLVDEVDQRTKSDHAGECGPSLVQALPTMAAFCQHRPEICRSARARVLHPVANGVQHGHRRLEKKPERERSTRAADQVRPEAIPPFVHGTDVAVAGLEVALVLAPRVLAEAHGTARAWSTHGRARLKRKGNNRHGR